MGVERRTLATSLWIVLLTIHLAALAQADPPVSRNSEIAESTHLTDVLEFLKEEESVSIASRYEQPISQAPSNVYVITDEDIRNSGAIDLPTILRRIPGMEVMQVTGADFNVSVRGNNQLQANKTLVMVDGRVIYNDALGIVFWKSIPVVLPEIKRIEVLKGPVSAVYGFNAFDGVINIITKSAEELNGTTVQFGGGEFGTISSAAVHAGTAGKFGYRLSLGRDQTQEWRDRDHLAFRSHKFNAQGHYLFSDLSHLTVSGGLVDTNRFDGTLFDTDLHKGTPTLGYTQAVFEKGAFLLRAFWNIIDDSVGSSNVPINQGVLVQTADPTGRVNNIPITSNTYNVDSQHAVEFAGDNRLVYGINFRHITLSSPVFDGFHKENRLGVYVQNEWKVMSQLKAMAGLRLDMNNQINPTWSPRVSLIYTMLPGHVIRVGTSVAYRPPPLVQSYASGLVVVTPPPPTPPPPVIPFVGSGNLKPERIVSYELEYQGWYFKHRLQVRAALFYNRIVRLIVPQATPTFATLDNVSGHANIYGAETGLDFLVTQWLSGFLNYAYESIDQTFSGAARRVAPRSKLNLGIRGDWENGLNADAAFHLLSGTTYPIADLSPGLPPGSTVSMRVGTYSLLNIRAGYIFWRQKSPADYIREAEVAITLFNALNDRHKEHPLGDTIGSRVMGWLTMKF